MPKALIRINSYQRDDRFGSSKMFFNYSYSIFWQTHVHARVIVCALVCGAIALIIERIDNRRVGSFRVACVNANPKTGEPNPQASREIASMQLS